MARAIVATISLVLSVCILSSCGEDVGPDGRLVGGGCVVHQDCAGGSVCLTDSDFPGGMCTIYCDTSLQCPEGTACVDKKSGLCLPLCRAHVECRPSYVCKDRKLEGESGEVLVCLKD